MKYDVAIIVTRLGAVQGSLSCEPDIYPDLSDLTTEMLPIVLLALMNRGLRSFAELTAYLDEHGADFGPAVTLGVLDEFRSTARYTDGTYDGLWRGDPRTGYISNISVT